MESSHTCQICSGRLIPQGIKYRCEICGVYASLRNVVKPQRPLNKFGRVEPEIIYLRNRA